LLERNETVDDYNRSKYENLDFEIIKETWNKYTIDDDIELKTRIVILRIMYDKNRSKNNHLIEFSQPLFTISCPLEKMGEKNNVPRPEEYYKLPSYNIKINEVEENVNLYLIKKSKMIIRIDYTVTEIKRITGRYDQNGNPFFLVTAFPKVNLIEEEQIKSINK
jgi:hypothetical protein